MINPNIELSRVIAKKQTDAEVWLYTRTRKNENPGISLLPGGKTSDRTWPNHTRSHLINPSCEGCCCCCLHNLWCRYSCCIIPQINLLSCHWSLTIKLASEESARCYLLVHFGNNCMWMELLVEVSGWSMVKSDKWNFTYCDQKWERSCKLCCGDRACCLLWPKLKSGFLPLRLSICL